MSEKKAYANLNREDLPLDEDQIRERYILGSMREVRVKVGRKFYRICVKADCRTAAVDIFGDRPNDPKYGDDHVLLQLPAEIGKIDRYLVEHAAEISRAMSTLRSVADRYTVDIPINFRRVWH